MPEVYNWQLGRKMLYPYEERHPKWQFAFVFNINRCLACQTCSMADKSTWLFSKGQEYMWWNNVETKPYGGYPQFYDVKITQLIEQVNPGGQVWNVRVGRKHHAPYGVFEGMTIFDAGAKVGQAAIGYIPTDQEWRFVNIYEDTATSMRALVEGIDKTGFSRDEPWKMTGSSLPEHETFFFYLQRICNHCTYPGCLAACPRKAIYKRPEDRAGEPGGPGVERAGRPQTPCALRGVRGDDHFRRRGQDRPGGDRLHPDGPRVALRQHL
jgi:nitrate reductase beta subunit